MRIWANPGWNKLHGRTWLQKNCLKNSNFLNKYIATRQPSLPCLKKRLNKEKSWYQIQLPSCYQKASFKSSVNNFFKYYSYRTVVDQLCTRANVRMWHYVFSLQIDKKLQNHSNHILLKTDKLKQDIDFLLWILIMKLFIVFCLLITQTFAIEYLRQIKVATTNCNDCGMGTFGQIHVKVQRGATKPVQSTCTLIFERRYVARTTLICWADCAAWL